MYISASEFVNLRRSTFSVTCRAIFVAGESTLWLAIQAPPSKVEGKERVCYVQSLRLKGSE